jgi:ABC-2 type transport system ATP-binding protein
MSAALQAVKATKWYGEVIAVNELSLEVQGGIVGLLGPNGAGKSTLLKLLVGQLMPSRGEVRVLGERVWENLPLLRQIGYCPEHEGLWDELTAVELVGGLTELHGFDRAEATRRAEAALDEVGLKDAMHRRVAEFSKGMRQRVKLAQAFAHDPKVVFLDEPLTGCDPIARVKVLEVVKRRAENGACILVSSHVLHEIETLTNNILLIHRGRVLAEGDLYKLRELIDSHPHKVRIECDRPRELAKALIGEEHVVSCEFVDGAAVLETREPDKLYPAIPDAARTIGTRITSLTSPDNNLASVFRYLTDEKAAS